MSATIRYAIYARQSVSDTDEDLSSCGVQFALCSDFIRPMTAEGWVWIGERLDDVGYSGADRDRPALQRLLQLVRDGAVDKVVVYRLDRLTRNLLDSVAILDEFRKAGADLLFVNAPGLGSAATDALLLNLLATSRDGAGVLWPLRGKVICPKCGRKMSTHGSHHRNFIYRYYRCRSHAGGRPPCKGSSVPAFELEKGVAEMLAKPSPTEGSPDRTAEEEQFLDRFRVAWGLLDLNTRLRLLPEVVEEVRLNEAQSSLHVRLDADAIERIGDGRKEG